MPTVGRERFEYRVGVTSPRVNFLSYDEDWMKLKVIDGGYTYVQVVERRIFLQSLLLDWIYFVYSDERVKKWVVLEIILEFKQFFFRRGIRC